MAQAEPLRVLVTGAGGGLGVRLVERLRAAGHSVRALVLPGDAQAPRLQALGCELVFGDVTDRSTLAGIGAAIDLVYHLAAVIVSRDQSVFARVNREGTRNVVACTGAARHFVYVSSASVTYPQRTPYAQAKFEAEAFVAGRGGGYTIVRPTLVFDEDGGHELKMFLRYLLRFPIVPFIGEGRARKRPVWSEDVVSGLAGLAQHRDGTGKIYNLSGAEPISMRELAQLLLRYHGGERPVVSLPVAACRYLARGLSVLLADPPLTLSAIAGVVNDADLDPSAAIADLGYRPIGVCEGFARCYAGRGMRGVE